MTTELLSGIACALALAYLVAILLIALGISILFIIRKKKDPVVKQKIKTQPTPEEGVDIRV